MMVSEYELGIRVKDMAAKYGISRETISRRLRRQAIGPRKVGLDNQQIKEAPRLYEQGNSLATIGERMGVSAQTVRSRLIAVGVKMRSSFEHLLP